MPASPTRVGVSGSAKPSEGERATRTCSSDDTPASGRSRASSAAKIDQSARASPGEATAGSMRCSRPRPLMNVPRFSAKETPGSSTVARRVTSFGSRSTTTSASSRASSASSNPQRARFSPCTSRPRIAPARMPSAISPSRAPSGSAARPVSRAPAALGLRSRLNSRRSPGPCRGTQSTTRAPSASRAMRPKRYCSSVVARAEPTAATAPARASADSWSAAACSASSHDASRPATCGARRRSGRWMYLKPSRPWSHIQLPFTASLSRGVSRWTVSPRAPMTMLQPVAQCGQTLRVSLRNQARMRKRKSFEVSAPTGQRSTIFRS